MGNSQQQHDYNAVAATDSSPCFRCGSLYALCRRSDLIEQLTDAVLLENADAVRELLDDHWFLAAELDAKVSRGQTLLHVAAKSGQTDIARLLLERGARPDVEDERGTTPLMYACFDGNRDVVAVLLEFGADANGRTDSKRCPPSDIPSSSSLVPDVSPLINDSPSPRRSIDLSRRSLDGPRRSLDGSRRSIDGSRRSIDGPRRSIDGSRRSFDSPRRSLDGSASPLRSSVELYSKRLFYQTPLHVAARKGYLGIVQLLLDHDADPSLQTRHRETAAFLAVRFRHKKILRLLVESDPDSVDDRNINGDTLLIWACLEGQLSMASYLVVDHGADCNATNLDGLAPLLAAVRSGRRGVVALLLDHGAHVNQQDNSGVSPLLSAVEAGLLDVCRDLLLRGADPLLEDRRGRSPKSEAAVGQNRQLVDVLAAAERSMKTSLQLRCWSVVYAHHPDIAAALFRDQRYRLGSILLG